MTTSACKFICLYSASSLMTWPFSLRFLFLRATRVYCVWRERKRGWGWGWMWVRRRKICNSWEFWHLYRFQFVSNSRYASWLTKMLLSVCTCECLFSNLHSHPLSAYSSASESLMNWVKPKSWAKISCRSRCKSAKGSVTDEHFELSLASKEDYFHTTFFL